MALTPIPDRIDDYEEAGQTNPALKEVKITELRAARKKLRDQRAEGIELVKYYRAFGPATMSGTLRVPKPVPRFTTGLDSRQLQHINNATSQAISVNTDRFLDTFFPDGGKSNSVTLKFYTNAGDTTAAYEITHPAKYMANKVSKSKSFWYNTLKGKDRDKRVLLIDATLTDLAKAIRTVEGQLDALGAAYEKPTATTPTANDNNAFVYDYSNLALKYNVGMVKEAYFSSGKGFQNLTNGLKGGNTPTSVSTAEELWKNSSSNKGMIWLYADGGKKDDFTVVPDKEKPNDSTFKRWAFQFHYNPGTLDMAWAGNPDVDVAMESSGLERFNMLGEHTMSTISFDLVLNRIFDFQYYGTDGKLKAGRRGDRNPYAPVQPSESDQKRIYNYGTMYDVEYLLSTILGYKLDTRFRGTTSDIGFLTGRPVDLHLGHKLRYWGYISGISVTHTIFDERMVPIFSTVRISFNRIPDYQV
jgi:hypothetical protein